MNVGAGLKSSLVVFKKGDGLIFGRLSSFVLRLRNHDEFYDLPRAGVDEHYGVIAPEEVFYRATTFDHDDVRRQIVKHDCRRQGHSHRYRNFSFAHRFHVRSMLAEVGLDFTGVDLCSFTALSGRACLSICRRFGLAFARGSSSLALGLSVALLRRASFFGRVFRTGSGLGLFRTGFILFGSFIGCTFLLTVLPAAFPESAPGVPSVAVGPLGLP